MLPNETKKERSKTATPLAHLVHSCPSCQRTNGLINKATRPDKRLKTKGKKSDRIHKTKHMPRMRIRQPKQLELCDLSSSMVQIYRLF